MHFDLWFEPTVIFMIVIGLLDILGTIPYIVAVGYLLLRYIIKLTLYRTFRKYNKLIGGKVK